MHGLGIIIGKIPKNGNVEPVYNLIFPSSYSVINDASPGILYLYTLYCRAIAYIYRVVKNVFQLISHFVPGSFNDNSFPLLSLLQVKCFLWIDSLMERF